MYYVYLVICGISGALLRYAVSLWLNMTFPVGTLLVNIIGCFLLAFLTQFLQSIPKLSPKVVSAVGTGFVGSFTTFSTFALESTDLLNQQLYLYATGYIFLSLVGGMIAVLVGFRTSKIVIATVKGV